MAVQQNSLKYFGGQQSGSGEAKLNIKKPNGVTQVYDPTGADETLDISNYVWLHGGQGNDSDPFKCNSRLYNPTNSGTTNFSVEQVIDVPDDTLDNPLDLLSLVSRCYDEGVKFVTIRYNDDIYWLTSYSPDPYLGGCLFEGFEQSINIGVDGSYVIIPRTGGSGGDQFVLTRANMTTAFTDTEYQDCVDALTGGKAVCVKVGTGADCMQLQLTQNTNPIGLQFEATYSDYHYLYAVSPTPGAHTISENIHHFGVPIYGSLQDAIADSDTLYPGMYFETNGFHTSGDGGAARYLVSSTGTANGMDVITLTAGKYALFQWSNEVTPEQLGAVGDGNTEDTTVFDYIINYFSSVLGDMQVKRVIRGSIGKRYKIHTLSVHDVCISRCVFKGRGSTTGYGIRLGNRAIIEKCILFDFVHAIFTSDGDSAISAVVTGCTISWCGNGISLQSGTSQAKSVDNILLENNYISRLGTLGHSPDDTPPNWDNTGCGIWLNGNWKNVNIVNNVLEYNGYAGLRLQCDRSDLEPSCTVTENYFEGNKFSAIRIMMQKRPCAVSIFGNQMTKLDTNVFCTTGIYCSSAVMSSGRIESPYGEYLGVVTSNSGSDVLSVNTENLRASNVSIYPGALTAKTFQLIPAKCANSRYASRQMLHIDLYVRSPDPSFTMSVSYMDKNNNAQTSNFTLTSNRHEVIEVPLIDVNLYDSTNYPVTCVVTAADGWFYIMITDMWIK